VDAVKQNSRGHPVTPKDTWETMGYLRVWDPCGEMGGGSTFVRAGEVKSSHTPSKRKNKALSNPNCRDKKKTKNSFCNEKTGKKSPLLSNKNKKGGGRKEGGEFQGGQEVVELGAALQKGVVVGGEGAPLRFQNNSNTHEELLFLESTIRVQGAEKGHGSTDRVG